MNTTLTIWSKDLTEIKKQFGKNLNDGEWNTFLQIGKVTGLNPFLKEIWAVKYGQNPASIFIGRDGYRKSAQTHPDYDFHVADSVYANDEFKVEDGTAKHSYSLNDRGQLVGAYCVVKRKNSSKPNFIFVEFKEYNTGKSLWATKPATMIKKVAEAQGLRMTFQELFGGTYDESEDWNEKNESQQIVTFQEVQPPQFDDITTDPKVLEPCPQCGNDLVFIKAGINKKTQQHYDAYYTCENKCTVEENGKRERVLFWAVKANKHLKKN